MGKIGNVKDKDIYKELLEGDKNQANFKMERIWMGYGKWNKIASKYIF